MNAIYENKRKRGTSFHFLESHSLQLSNLLHSPQKHQAITCTDAQTVVRCICLAANLSASQQIAKTQKVS